MCLAIPALVVELDAAAQSAVVDLDGVRKGVSVALVPQVRLGDYVIVHVGHAIGVLDEDEARQTLALFAELGARDAAPDGDAAGVANTAGPDGAR